MGNAHPSIAPYELYATADGDLVVAVGNDRQFRALAQVLGCPEIADEDALRQNAARVANRARLSARSGGRLAAGPAAEWVALLSRARVPAGQVNDIAAAFDLAASIGLEPTVEVPGDGGRHRAADAQPDPHVGDARLIPVGSAAASRAGERRVSAHRRATAARVSMLEAMGASVTDTQRQAQRR